MSDERLSRADRLRAASSDAQIAAARIADWGQVVANGGPPCFHLEDGSFCLRTKRWGGHDQMHRYVPLDALLSHIVQASEIAERRPL